MPVEKALITELRRLLGAERCRTDAATRTCYAYDATQQQAMPDAVLTPKTTEEVARIMQLASQHEVPVVPRGAGSGLTGGSIPIHGGLVLDFAAMNQILSIDPAAFVARVQPGVVLLALQEAVEAQGLFYPPDPASHEVCTIGGTVAECAGGLRGVKYGVTRDYVLGLEVVLPNGEVIHTGSMAMKSVTGYDLTRLLVGSEGTLGLLTEIALRLIPKPATAETVLATFTGLEQAAEATDRILHSGVLPRALEIIDEHCLRAVRVYATQNAPLNKTALPASGAVVLAEVDGPAVAVAAERDHLIDACRAAGATGVRWSADPIEREELWSVRRMISPALWSICAKKINEDICVPRSRLVESFERIDAIATRHDLMIARFGHAGDGNVHANILLSDTAPETLTRAERAVDELFRAAIELGGTLTGEHGVGTTKSAYLALECGPREIALMRGIKHLFDPNGLLNPGKIFPPPEASRERPRP